MAEPSFKDLAYRALANTLGGPVDVTTMLMRPFGYNVPPENVFGSSEYIGQRLEQGGLVSEARDPTQEFLASMAVPTPTVPLKAAGMIPELLAGMMGVTAYHGSPYLFQQLNPAMAGRGEGVQSYGAGAGYMASARPVAQEYAKRGNDIETIQNINERMSNLSKIMDEDAVELGSRNFRSERGQKAAEEYDNLMQQRESLIKSPGYLYKGEIPDELVPDMMVWDKPFAEQPEKVKNAFRRLFNDPNVADEETRKWFKETYKGPMGNYYDQLAMSFNLSGKEDVSRLLAEEGVPGVQYLERGTKGVGEGTTNYVVFRPEDFKIETINDEPIEEWIRKGLLD